MGERGGREGTYVVGAGVSAGGLDPRDVEVLIDEGLEEVSQPMYIGSIRLETLASSGTQ